MPDSARVHSIDAIDSFRGALLVYLEKMRPLVEDACDEVFRTRDWLRRDRRVHWENQVRVRARKLEDAKQALFSAELANLREPTSAERIAVHRARRALDEAEERLRTIKRWTLDFEREVEPLVKQLDQLRTMLSNDMPKAALHLARIVQTLEAYVRIAPVPGSEPAAQSGSNAGPEDLGRSPGPGQESGENLPT
jgi:hypothetical protein